MFPDKDADAGGASTSYPGLLKKITEIPAPKPPPSNSPCQRPGTLAHSSGLITPLTGYSLSLDCEPGRLRLFQLLALLPYHA